ncbi:putative ribosome assembly protein Noc2 [Paratrimastix pyriformis]|uniref:Ribosome assembly protein Noc2 n=1 Tax=Paratrimastix pyriformis TaxID=342808 RepID=A0ABQ8UNC4_9EUKA|nr:putative ribosome assembly protein Noc2 [Paratrimastix pyriformis]
MEEFEGGIEPEDVNEDVEEPIDEEETEEISGAEEEDDDGEEGPQQKNAITRQEFEACVKKIREPNCSIKEIKKMLSMFTAACHVADVDAKPKQVKEKGSHEKPEKEKKARKYRPIASGELFTQLMNFCFSDFLSCLQEFVYRDSSKKATKAAAAAAGTSAEVATLRALPNLAKVEPLMRSFIMDTCHFLGSMQGQSTTMVPFMMTHLTAAAPLIAATDRTAKQAAALAAAAGMKTLSPAKKLLKAVLPFWLSDDEATHKEVLLLMHRLGRLSDALLEAAIRGAYDTFHSAANTPFPQSHLINGLVELCKINSRVTYRVAFMLVRELAGALRDAIAKRTETHTTHADEHTTQTRARIRAIAKQTRPLTSSGPDARTSVAASLTIRPPDPPRLWWRVMNAVQENANLVLSWKFLNRMRIWRSVLVEMAGTFLEVCQGAAQLANNVRVWPIRFHLVHLMLDVCHAARQYAPASSLLLEVLGSPDLQRATKPTKPQPVELVKMIRAPMALVRTRHYLDACVTAALDLLLQFCAQEAASVAFPELATPVVALLRRASKLVISGKHRKQMTGLVQQLMQNTEFITRQRATAEVAPADLKAVADLEGKLAADAQTLPPLLKVWQTRSQELARQHTILMLTIITIIAHHCIITTSPLCCVLQHAVLMSTIKEGEQILERGRESLMSDLTKAERKQLAKEIAKAKTEAKLAEKKLAEGEKAEGEESAEEEEEEGEGKKKPRMEAAVQPPKKKQPKGSLEDADALVPFDLNFDDDEEAEDDAFEARRPAKGKAKAPERELAVGESILTSGSLRPTDEAASEDEEEAGEAGSDDEDEEERRDAEELAHVGGPAKDEDDDEDEEAEEGMDKEEEGEEEEDDDEDISGGDEDEEDEEDEDEEVLPMQKGFAHSENAALLRKAQQAKPKQAAPAPQKPKPQPKTQSPKKKAAPQQQQPAPPKEAGKKHPRPAPAKAAQQQPKQQPKAQSPKKQAKAPQKQAQAPKKQPQAPKQAQSPKKQAQSPKKPQSPKKQPQAQSPKKQNKKPAGKKH